MSTIDIGRLRTWIGAQEQASDIISAGLAARFAATFDGRLADADAAPLGIHWCLSPSAAPTGELGPDGHPRRGGFLPPVPLPRRMWAGGTIEFHAPARIGDRLTRRSRITDVSHKTGRSGQLVFVTVEDDFFAEAGMVISERRDIVYREAASGPAAGQARLAPRGADRSETVDASTILLFRYSALTFNSHRIHYDLDYARDEEHYPGLVVHGPLQATLLMNLAAKLAPGLALKTATYRGVSQLIQGKPFTINAILGNGSVSAWSADAAGHCAMTLEASFGRPGAN
ncbi:MAG: MaoC family dehydratase N-terminal domain-containing protein [Pseudomonadota bacterium]